MFLRKSLENLNNLIDALSFTEDNFGKTLAQSPMMIEPRIAQIFKRQIAQLIERAFDSASSGAHFIKQFANPFGLHQKPGSVPRAVARGFSQVESVIGSLPIPVL